MTVWVVHAHVRDPRRAAGAQVVEHRLGRRDRDREADVVRRARVGDRGVDADHAAVDVDERTAGVAGVDRGVGLDRVDERLGAGDVHGAAEPGDDARRDGRAPGDAERVADRDDRVADLRATSESPSCTVGRSGAVDLDDREILGAVLADDASAHGVAVAQRHDELRRPRSSVSAFATCALVTMMPSDATMKPVPVPDWLSIASGLRGHVDANDRGLDLGEDRADVAGLGQRGRRAGATAASAGPDVTIVVESMPSSTAATTPPAIAAADERADQRRRRARPTPTRVAPVRAAGGSRRCGGGRGRCGSGVERGRGAAGAADGRRLRRWRIDAIHASVAVRADLDPWILPASDTLRDGKFRSTASSLHERSSNSARKLPQ